MWIDIITLFPEVFDPFLQASIIGRAVTGGLLSIRCINPRNFAHDKHKTVDDRPFGGGPGMVLMCQPMFDALAFADEQDNAEAQPPGHQRERILLTPQGEPLTQTLVAELASKPRLVLICGHYEGFDERIRIGSGAREVSIGDYVLSGGEPAAMVLVDAVTRLLPGALGDADSAGCDSFADGLLEYPQYTRPREFNGMAVPEVLLSGDHGRIAAWRKEQALKRTRDRRPDLLADDESAADSCGDG